MNMNIESVQAANPPQRTATTETSPQAIRQEKTAAARQNSIRAETPKKIDSEQNKLSVQDAVKRLEGFVSIARADISFSIDEASGVQVVKIMDGQSKEVIRQFPSEEAIRIAQALDQLQGVFVRDKV
ncbi:MAG: flagellar protein FlaG [Sterolibacterium sp.]